MPSRHYIKKVEILDEKSTPEARAKRLRRVRNLANLSRKALCEDGLINVNTLKGWELGRYGGLPKDGAEKIIQRIAREGVHCTLDWLLHEIGPGPRLISNDPASPPTSPTLPENLEKTFKTAIHNMRTPLATIKLGIDHALHQLQELEQTSVQDEQLQATKTLLHNALTETKHLSETLEDLSETLAQNDQNRGLT